MNRTRLEGEAIWDSIHVAAGDINFKMGGRSVMPPLTQAGIEWHPGAGGLGSARRPGGSQSSGRIHHDVSEFSLPAF